MVLRLCFRSFKAMISIKYLSERTVKAALSNCFLTSGAKKRNRRQNEGCWVVIVSRPAEPEQQIVRFLLYSFSLVRETMNSLFGRLYARLSPAPSCLRPLWVELQVLGVVSQRDWWFWRDIDGHYIQTRCENGALHCFDGTQRAPHEVCPPLLPM